MKRSRTLPADFGPYPPDRYDEPVVGPHAEAIRLLLSLGQEAVGQDLDRAQDCFTRAAELAQGGSYLLYEARALRGLGLVHVQAGRFEEAEHFLDLAAKRGGNAEPALDSVSRRNLVVMLRLAQGQLDEAFLLLDEILLPPRPAENPEWQSARAFSLQLLGIACRERGDLDGALRHFEESLVLRRKVDDQAGIAVDLDHLGKLRLRLGQYREAGLLLREALEKRRSLRDRRGAAVTANHLASTLFVLGELDEARTLFEECRISFEETGQPRALARVESNLGLLEITTGRVGDAERHLRKSLDRLRGLGDLPGQANALNNLASLALVCGRPDDALRLAGESIAIRLERGLDAGLAKPLFNRGRAHLELSRPEEAREAAQAALDAASSVGSLEQKAEALALLAAALRTTDPADAERKIQEAREVARATGDPRLLAAVELRTGALALERNHLQEAQEALSRARRLSRGAFDAFGAAQLFYEEGRLLARAGSEEAAAERLRRADEAFQSIGNVRWRIRALSELAAALSRHSPEESRTRLETACALAAEHGLAAPEASVFRRDRTLVCALEASLERWDANPHPQEALATLTRLLREIGARAAELRLASPITNRLLTSTIFNPPKRPRVATQSESDEQGRRRVALFGSFELSSPDPEETGAPDRPVDHGMPQSADAAPRDLGPQSLAPDETHFGGSAIPDESLAVDSVSHGSEVRSEFQLGGGRDCLVVAWLLDPSEEEPALVRVALKGFVSWLERLAENDPDPRDHPPGSTSFAGIVGSSVPMRTMFTQLERAVASDVSVLLLGESGTGKELAARALHDLSARRDGPFVAISCPSIPRELVEAELFGHEKGAFTGASVARAGKIELADGGTLFLDEIGDVALAVQVKLLRFLQEREFERIGGRKSLRVDVRVIAATSRNLEEDVQADRFRKDLYYRLSVFPIRLPSLRERIDDIPLLLEHFLRRTKGGPKQAPLRVAPETLTLLAGHDWPGNVRELQNVLEYMAASADGPVLEPKHLPTPFRERKDATEASALRPGETLAARVGQLEARIIFSVLESCDWNQSAAARQLGVTEGTIRNRIRRYGLRPSR